jgi:hypothetical protein
VWIMIDEKMSLLARETAEAAPSAAVERNLVAAFRARQARRRLPYSAIAASVVLLAASSWLIRSSSPGPVPAQAEVVTDFIAVAGTDPTEPVESPILVRVKLPRTALVKFGLPMNEERSSEFVKADVVLGNDGLARAIRFVQ